MHFRAKVLTSTSAIEFIELDAVDEAEATRVVGASGGRVLALKQSSAGALTSRRSKAFNLAIFNQQLFALLDAGQPIVDTIEVLARKDRKEAHRAIFDTLLQNLRQGKQLSEAMAALPSVFPALYVAMVRSSETTGTVRTSISRFMKYQAQAEEIRSKLVGAAIYPAILLSVGFVVISFLMLYVLPKFSEVFAEVSSRKGLVPGFIERWGAFVEHNTVLAWSTFAAIIVMVIYLATNARFKSWVGQKLLLAPLIGEAAWTLQLARMYRTLGMLLSSGVSVLTAMRMTSATLPLTMQESMLNAIDLVSEGRSMSQVMLECGLSTEVAQKLLAAGESSGRLDDMMARIADFYDNEMKGWIIAASRVVEPVLMLVLGLVIGVVVLMLYSPIFDLSNAF
jgi:general secretion pathway protein F